MKGLGILRGRQGVVLDTMLLIYFFEDQRPQAGVCEQLLTSMADGAFSGVVTPIPVAELLVKPLRGRRADVAQRYRNALNAMPNLTVSVIDQHTGALAGALRAKYNLPLPDLFQVATSMRSPKPTLVTNDRDLKRVSEVDVVLLDDLAATSPASSS
jgi:predicted nucleic acid-binding protein